MNEAHPLSKSQAARETGSSGAFDTTAVNIAPILDLSIDVAVDDSRNYNVSNVCVAEKARFSSRAARRVQTSRFDIRNPLSDFV